MTTVPQVVPFPPTETDDYIIKNDNNSLGLYANRNIKKGQLIFDDSIEFIFSDVKDGDCLLLESTTVMASKKCEGGEVLTQFPLTREVLTRTHGVPKLYPDPTGRSGGIVSWHLEIPVMLINHSCNPNVIQSSHCTVTGEDIAARDIEKGEELTFNYNLQFYNHGPFFDECNCGSSNCLGHMHGFQSLSDKDKEKLWPLASEAVQAMYTADTSEGPPLIYEQLTSPPRVQLINSDKVPRHVFPGPSHAHAEVAVRQQEDSGDFGLYASKDFKFGERVYEFWCQEWILGGNIPIDMVFAVPQTANDPAEGTVIRVSPRECGHQDRDGTWMCSGWDLLTTHSCDPNVMYHHKTSMEDEDWRVAFAAKDIKAGDQLSVDFNSNVWDRSSSNNSDLDTCNCEASNCTGTKKGFKFLSCEAQEERKKLSWRRVPPPNNGEIEVTKHSRALSLHVRDQIRLASSSSS